MPRRDMSLKRVRLSSKVYTSEGATPLLPEKISSSNLLAGIAEEAPRKPRWFLGYLPIWSECVPLDKATGQIDWPGFVVNIGAGLIMGVRESLGGIVSASMVFSSGDRSSVTAMLPWGIKMMLYTQSVSVLWYAMFGRIQYGYATQQDLICILQADMATRTADLLHDQPEKVPATVVAIICLSSILCGISNVILGKLGLGSYMLLFPTPVINGFLGAIGVVVVRAALMTSTGVKFQYFYPSDWATFLLPERVFELCCMIAMVVCIRAGPGALNQCFPKSNAVRRLGGLICQLLPLLLFYMVTASLGVNLDYLQSHGWTYPRRGAASGPMALWTTYSVDDVDWATVAAMLPEMPSLILMSAMCTMMGVLAITDAFPSGPEGDPAPNENIDFDTELCIVGASSVLLGCTGGNLNFHKFSAIQLRLDGGSHRIAVVAIAFFSGALFLSGIPIGTMVPRWFLAGLFMNTGVHFLKGTLLSYRTMPWVSWRGWNFPSPQYIIPLCTVGVAVFSSPATAILSGLVLSIGLFLVNSSASSPVSNVVIGDSVVSRSKRPFWEMRVLRQEGDRIVLLYLQGQLFFGSARKLVANLAAAAASDRVRFCILSFARVPGVDASAARHLKTAADRLKLRGCRVICCRMNQEVYRALSAAKVVVAPDLDLLNHLQNLRWKTVPMPTKKLRPSLTMKRPQRSRGGSEPTSPVLSPRGSFVAPFSSPHPHRRKSLEEEPIVMELDLEKSAMEAEFRSPGSILSEDGTPGSTSGNLQFAALGDLVDKASKVRPDAFAHETDALDYCDEKIVGEFCYGKTSDEQVDPYMIAYRVATRSPGQRLPEWAFEDMNNLPRGLMDQLKEFCTVHANLPAWTKLTDDMHVEGALCFILRGSLSIIQMLPIADGVSSIDPGVHGFSFRQGKRLINRYPPGHVAGKNGFFLQYSHQVIDPDMTPKVIVSCKMCPPAEIWVLQPEQWEELPMELKGPLTEMLCVQFADDEQHSRLQER